VADVPEVTREGDRRGTDRRGVERRRGDRRAPPPPWRRPWALVAYGVAGTLLAVFLVNAALGDGDDEVPKDETFVAAPPAAPVAAPAAPASAAPQPALGTEDFERLSIEGDAARGRVVQAQLFCDAPAPVALASNADTVEAAVAALVDADRRVPGAVCKWGRRDDPRREDFLLLVPPALAAQFSSAPVVMDGYVRRRHLVAEVEWLGKSNALALRTAGVFRGLTR
jgi:hypothetical protein